MRKNTVKLGIVTLKWYTYGAGQVMSVLFYWIKVNELLSELKDIFQGIYLIKDLSSKRRLLL